MIKINLHCGEKTRDRYQNMDTRKIESENINLVDDYSLLKYGDESIQEIIAHPGCLESTARSEVVNLIKSWHRKISTGGMLKVSFLDLKKLTNAYCYDRVQTSEIENAIVGMQSLHDMFEIRTVLISLGFKLRYCDFSIEDFIGTIHAEK
jgi:predicted SAM-dependent methyltransferase